MIDCQFCGARVPSATWPLHRAEHVTGKRPTLPALTAFARQTDAAQKPFEGVRVRLWVMRAAPLGRLLMTELPSFDAPFEHEGVRYELMSMSLGELDDTDVDIVLRPGSHYTELRPLNDHELDAARIIAPDHSCGTRCLRCWAVNTGQL